jgi:hypothetical protein
MASLSLSIKIGFEVVGCVLIALCFMRGFLAHLDKACDRVIAFGEKTVFDLFAVLVQVAMFVATVRWFHTSVFVACVMGVYLVTFGFLAYADNLLDLAIYHLHVKNSPEMLAAVAAAEASKEINPKDT